MREDATAGRAPTTRLSAFLRAHQESIIALWIEETRALRPARTLSDSAIRDHLPAILTRIADLVAAGDTGEEVWLGGSPGVHAHDRLARGFDLEDVLAEYAVLRRVILDTWEKQVGPAIDLGESRRLNLAVDQAIGETALHFARGRERILKALDRISEASLGTADVDTFLRLLAMATLESTEAVDTVVVLLREGDRVRVRVAVGLEEELETSFSLAVGEGFAGTIAANGQPLFLADAAEDPLVKSPVARSKGIHALYGVPLVHRGDVIGVAHMGSRTPRTFSDDDKLLFRSMVARASAAIVHAQLVEEREEALARERTARDDADRALALLDALLAAAPIGIAFIDHDLRYVRVNDALAKLNGRPVDRHIGRKVAEVLPDDAPFLEPLLRRVLDTREAIVDLQFEAVAPSGPPDEKRSFLATYFPVRRAEELVGVGGVVTDVTSQKRAADDKAILAARIDAERRWVQAILENLPVGVVVAEGDDGRILFSNSRAAELVGRSPLRVGDAEMHDADGGALAGTDRPLGRALRGETVVAHHVLVRSPSDARMRILRVNAAPILAPDGRSAALATLDDVTEARRVEELQRFLAEASKALAETIDSDTALDTIARLAVPRMADWCIVEAADERDHGREPLVIAHVDPSMVERVRELRRHYPPDPSAPRGVSAVLRTGRAELYPTISDDMLVGRTSDETRIARDLGLRSAMIVPLVARGTILGAVSFASGASGRSFDEKDLAAAEEFARRAGLALDNARLLHGMRDAVRLREEVLAIVSHDLRNALNSILVAASMLADTTAEPGANRRAGMILRGAHRMSHLITSLLDVASIQAGRLRIEKSRHDITSLVDEAIELAEPQATERQLRLVAEKSEAHVPILCDRERVLQVLSNLLGNAVKFANTGSDIVVAVETTERHAHVSVADRGPGIPEHELARLFEPYWSAARHEKKGTGLGLYIAKSIVEAHGGKIWGESREAMGTTFHFTLPRG